MGYFGASLGNLSKQLITEYVEAKTAQYVNSVAETSVLNHLVEENIQKTFQTAGVNANVVAHGTLTYEPIAGGMVRHTVPWSAMTQAERRAFQHSYTRHSAELGLPNWLNIGQASCKDYLIMQLLISAQPGKEVF
jgi:hypothetical protein